jgi:sugar phosphate isomerase/epimerase
MEQRLNRRRFLGAAMGTGAAAATAGAWAPAAVATRSDATDVVPRDAIGIQLYSLRRIMNTQQNAANVLHQLGRMGYAEVEMAGHYGYAPADLRKVLDSAGVRAVSGHDGLDLDGATWRAAYQHALDAATTLGQRFTGVAWHPGPHTEERYRHLAGRFNQAGAMAKASGLQFFYHNHDFEFSNKQANGEPLYNILLDETDPDLVKFELDLYWIVYGGESPVHYLGDDPRRYPLYHVKDKTWRTRADARPWEQWEDVGPGSIDFPDTFEAGKGGPKHYIVEHDWPPLSHPNDQQAEIKTAQQGVDYLRNVRF